MDRSSASDYKPRRSLSKTNIEQTENVISLPEQSYIDSYPPSNFRARIRHKKPRLFGLALTLSVVIILLIVFSITGNKPVEKKAKTAASKHLEGDETTSPFKTHNAIDGIDWRVNSRSVIGDSAAVSTDVKACSEIGADILRKGGTAGDAAVASTVCIGAVNMFASGIGGGGFAVARRSDGNAEFIDFRESAPKGSHPDMFKDGIDWRVNSRSVIGDSAAVSTDVKACSEIGADILRKGGTAGDAAVASTVCIGAVNMFASGIGGGGFAVARRSDGNAEFIDFRESAPKGSHPDMFKDSPGEGVLGFKSIATPGEIRGLEYIWKNYGKLSWRELFEPTIQLLNNGFNASSVFAARLRDNTVEQVRTLPEWHSLVYNKDGDLVKEGNTVTRPDLAKTLRQIADHGADVFYTGDIANKMIKRIQAGGGFLSKEDLRNYKVKTSQPLTSKYRNYTVLTSAGSSSGAALIEELNILNQYDMTNGPLDQRLHWLIESMKWASAGRTRLADPDFLSPEELENVKEIMTEKFAKEAVEKTSDSKTYPAEHYGPMFESTLKHGTTHISVLDKDGMAFSITSTINTVFGSQRIIQPLGIIMNNEMADFSTPGVPNVFDLKPSPRNYPEEGKRPVSSCAPSILVGPDSEILVIGGEGGSLILTALAQVIVNIIDRGLPLDSAIDDARLHNQLYPSKNIAEAHFLVKLRKALEERGHEFEFYDARNSLSNILAVYKSINVVAKSDPRKHGEAVAI